ncbi:Ribonuclease H [Denitrovibrio acetiphilus DSM 12809]|uniref:Ribonuclease HII n=1 Tax=Denitrovibrio acetiphilus (strain DSM 12809 / NBRC 114555 / N2460) TaxID=522772 RepID=D4H3S2_DENA2|nr:ribonuclease HII [Denitrovibrio acetiphilus]ADD69174.1 Ribonuclease H [Denitrovibrio acetiphilus DSM 12809]
MLIVGIDEVGRGCLAGPVVAGAVLLPENFSDERLVDSKKISEKKRKIMDGVVRANAIAFGIGAVSNEDIDRYGIVPCTKKAMMLALEQISVSYDKVIVDAVKLEGVKVPLEHPFKAEDKFQCVAAASIIAKVYRDALMTKLHINHPDYGWYSNKGYGAKVHIEKIKEIGLTPLHRRSFCGNFIK